MCHQRKDLLSYISSYVCEKHKYTFYLNLGTETITFCSESEYNTSYILDGRKVPTDLRDRGGNIDGQ